MAAVKSAPKGKLPEELLQKENLDAFCKGLAESGAQFYPEPNALTTIKQRTRFQAQLEKVRHLLHILSSNEADFPFHSTAA